MVQGTSFMGLGGPNLVKGATGQVIDAESLGGARTHTEKSGVAHYNVPDDQACIRKLRELIDRLPRVAVDVPHAARSKTAVHPSAKSLDDLLPADHRMSYDMHVLLRAIVDDGKLDEMQEGLAKEMICGDASIQGIPVGIIANQRGLVICAVGGILPAMTICVALPMSGRP